MFENKLHVGTRLQQNCKLVKAGQLTTQSDAAYEEHVYGGLVVHEHLQKIVLYAWEHFSPVPGPAFAEKQRCGIQMNGSAAMTDTAMVHACGVRAAG
jgi:hypothetical protein